MGSFVGSANTTLMWIVRFAFLVLAFGLAGQALVVLNFSTTGYVSAALIAGVGLVILFGDLVIRNKQITTISAIYFGLLMGFLLGQMFTAALRPFIEGFLAG